jgi:hypothetical protein
MKYLWRMARHAGVLLRQGRTRVASKGEGCNAGPNPTVFIPTAVEKQIRLSEGNNSLVTVLSITFTLERLHNNMVATKVQ